MKTYSKQVRYGVGEDGLSTGEVVDTTYFDENKPNSHIPDDPDNMHYAYMLQQVADGLAQIADEVDITVYPDIPTMRQRMYAKEGIPTEELVVALWERIVEGRTADEAGITGLQTRRVVVKNTHPKPE